MRNSADTGGLVCLIIAAGAIMTAVDGSLGLWWILAPAILAGLAVTRSIR